MPKADIHPKYFDGKQNFSNAEGRVERFNEKFAKQNAKLEAAKKASDEQKAKNKVNAKPKKDAKAE
jgi:large subunit ribosomal protein L31